MLVNKYYIDDMYQWIIDKVVLASARFVGTFDRIVVNDIGVNGPANAVRETGFRVRYLESGMLYNYALAMALGAIIVALFWWLVL